MHYVILRDDDTCAVTPPESLERLYRPFLERGFPVNLAAIPEVRTDVRMATGALEGFLAAGRPRALSPSQGGLAPLAGAGDLVAYLRANPGYQLVQHGCHHDLFEFDGSDRSELARRLDLGTARLQEAGWSRPPSFVAPYDRLSRAAWLEVTSRFPLVSTGWFELGRMPRRWLPAYAAKKLAHRRHWRAGGSVLLSHPGCLLSYQRPRADMAAEVARAVLGARLTVLVTHWWEYFRDGAEDRAFIDELHAVAAWLASRPDIRVISFSDVAAGGIPLS